MNFTDDFIELWAMRHGQTGWNVEGRLQGQSDTKLTKVGVEQTVDLGRSLKHEKIDVAYSGPLDRVKETCKIIQEQNDFGFPIRIDDRITERSFGRCEGMLESKYKEMHPNRWNLNHTFLGEGVELPKDMLKRTNEFLKDIQAEHKKKKILLSTHVGTMRAIYYALNPDQISSDGDMNGYQAPKNCSVERYFL